MASLEQGLYIGIVWYSSSAVSLRLNPSGWWTKIKLEKALIFYSVYLFKTYYVSTCILFLSHTICVKLYGPYLLSVGRTLGRIFKGFVLVRFYLMISLQAKWMALRRFNEQLGDQLKMEAKASFWQILSLTESMVIIVLKYLTVALPIFRIRLALLSTTLVPKISKLHVRSI